MKHRKQLVTTIVTARAATLAIFTSLLVALAAVNTTVANATTVNTTVANTTAASTAIVRSCSADSTRNGDRVRVCVQELNGSFNAVAEVSFPAHAMPVNVFLQQCRGDGTACAFVGTHGSGILTGHKFLASSIVTGAHGHSYRAVVYVGATQQWRVISPFIAYP